MTESHTQSILIIEDEKNMRTILAAILRENGFRAIPTSSLSEAKEVLRSQAVSVVLSDLRLVNEEGTEIIKWLRQEELATPVVIITAHGTVDSAVSAMKEGAFDYLTKPFENEDLIRVMEKAIRSQAESFPAFQATASPVIGKGAKMFRVFNVVAKVAKSDSTVLITGESGTGKELIAQAIHEKSPRKEQPFIKINCAAIPATLMESELFGYERGAFTGAVGSKPGRFELADNGTLFLDEVGEMSTEMQVKLLRVLQDGAFERVGGLQTRRADVRLITATNKDLKQEVKEGRFRADLFYRLNVVPIPLPPLRERQEDMPQLILHFIQKFCRRMQKNIPVVSPEALNALMQYRWPGNIRQLENAIERMMVMHETETVELNDLPEEIAEGQFEAASLNSLKAQVKSATRQIERRAIERALKETEDNVTQAAKRLSISRKGLQLKMKELGLRS